MTVNTTCKNCVCERSPNVKLRAGASIIKVKPLFTFDSKYLIVASGCEVKVFSTASGECTLVFKSHDYPIVSTQISPKNNLQILSCSETGELLRWDYADGKVLKRKQLRFMIDVAYFYAPPNTKTCFIVTSKKSDFSKTYYKVFSAIQKGREFSKGNKIISKVSPSANAFAFGPEGNYAVGISGIKLLVHDLKTKKSFLHLCGAELTCVACHPTDYITATGDVLGRITVWTGVHESTQPTRSLYHWHSLQLPYLAFSPEGSHIYSGGGESVLLKVNHSTGLQKKLPRLGLPISCLSVSPDNSYIATAHIDNAVQIISSQYEVIKVIQGLTRGHCQNAEIDDNFAHTMLYDMRSKSVVMNGRPGHLQFYDILQDRQLFQLDIVRQNLICQERNKTVYNTDVVTFSMDDKGLWLATVECRNDGETSPEMKLKFWQFNETTQVFTLNTSIFLPHNKRMNCLKFQPSMSLIRDSIPLAVSTSSDGKFKIWSLSDQYNDKLNWACDLLGYYKDLPAGDASFSEDGSLLCVAFDKVATLWIAETNVLKAALSNNTFENPIRQVIFGRNVYRHLLASSTDYMLTVWNVLTLTVLWNVKCRVEYLIDDPLSGLMAAFTVEKNLFVFEPSEPKPVAALNNVSSVPVVSALFVPSGIDDAMCWHSKSKLFFLNQKQELITVEPEEEIEDRNPIKLTLPQDQLMTPFGFLQAEHSTTDVKPVKDTQHILEGTDGEKLKEAADLPCPTYVNTVALCEAVLPSLLKVSSKKRNKGKSKDDITSDVDMDSGIGSEIRSDISAIKNNTNKKNLKEDFCLLNNYSFMLNDYQHVFKSDSCMA